MTDDNSIPPDPYPDAAPVSPEVRGTFIHAFEAQDEVFVDAQGINRPVLHMLAFRDDGTLVDMRLPVELVTGVLMRIADFYKFIFPVNYMDAPEVPGDASTLYDSPRFGEDGPDNG